MSEPATFAYLTNLFDCANVSTRLPFRRLCSLTSKKREHVRHASLLNPAPQAASLLRFSAGRHTRVLRRRTHKYYGHDFKESRSRKPTSSVLPEVACAHCPRMSSTAFIRSAPTSFRLVLPTGHLSNTSQLAGGFALGATSTGNASSPAQAPLISGVGGAGLILVFVACALLFVILILAFIFRGLRGPRSRLESGGAPWDDFEAPTTRPSPPALGEKPQMCDIHVSVQSMQRYAPNSTASWRNVQVSILLQ